MSKKKFMAQVAIISDKVEYVAAGGGGLFDPGEIAERVLPHLEGGPLFAYLFRRFGYPSFGWDDHKQLVTYMITTPMENVFVSITPYMGGSSGSLDSSCLMFGYCVDNAIEEDYYALLMQGKRDEWKEYPRYKALVQAFGAAMRDLLRPVYVRDVPINCYGLVRDEECGKLPRYVEAYHAAGYPIPRAFLKDTKRYETFTDALITLGDGSMDKGIDNVIKTAATVKFYSGEEQEGAGDE